MDITILAPQDVDACLDDLAALLLDCVADGASIGFLAGLDAASARDWWRSAVAGPDTVTWVARLETGGPVVGTVQLKCVPMPNGAHRADVAKLLVRRDARGRGIAPALMAALEAEAARLGRWLLVLDTEQGSTAERLYEKWGWTRFGVLEDHAAVPSGELRPTVYFSKRLGRTPS